MSAEFVMFVLTAYLVGSIPVGVIVGRLRGFDPRAVGSGNTGMTNVARAGGKSAAAITFVGDLLKGLLPVLAAEFLGFHVAALALVGLAAFAGAIFSIYLGFHGGRGVATSVGVWLGLAPFPILIALAVFLAMVAATRVVSLGSICAAIALVPAAAALGCPRPYVLLAILMSALVLVRHHENIRRLISGEEPAMGAKRARTR
ncbi:MAG: glycerol-3-phosphate 1-O-acyltransferase PlsY [Candidatus Binataceae bacterium]